jgi:hypothetical protein
MARIFTLVLAVSLPLTQTASTADVKPMNRFKLANDLRAYGVGHTIKVTEIEGTVVRGKLKSIDVKSFQIVPEHETRPIVIQFDQVVSANTGFFLSARRALVDSGEGIAGGVLFIALLLSYFVTGLFTLGHYPTPMPG